MGILSRLAGMFQNSQARSSSQMFYEKEFYQAAPKINGDELANLPNPGPGLTGDYQVDPARVFSPDPHFRTSMDQLTAGSGDIRIERTSRDDMTVFLESYQTVDSIDIKVPAHGVFVPSQLHGFGWKQQWIPASEMRMTEAAFAPPPLLSQPIHETIVDVNMQGKRVPVKLTAPKPTKG